MSSSPPRVVVVVVGARGRVFVCSSTAGTGVGESLGSTGTTASLHIAMIETVQGQNTSTHMHTKHDCIRDLLKA